MPQILKDEIKENILKAALHEFEIHGYHSATMRRIAEKAKIPAGLIYSYYKNKEALFDAVLTPVLYDWERTVTAGDDHHTGEVHGLSKAEFECTIQLFEHRREFMILMDKSTGTKYEQEKDHLIAVIESHLSDHKKDGVDPIFLHIVANNFVDGLLQLMYHYQGKEWAVMMLHKLSEMYFHGIGL